MTDRKPHLELVRPPEEPDEITQRLDNIARALTNVADTVNDVAVDVHQALRRLDVLAGPEDAA